MVEDKIEQLDKDLSLLLAVSMKDAGLLHDISIVLRRHEHACGLLIRALDEGDE